MYLRKLCLAALVLAVAGCAVQKRPDSDPATVAKARYVHSGPPEMTLYTMINNRSGGGAHTSLMINAPSERVIFDPAGSFYSPVVPERDDVLFGITPAVERAYRGAHARETFHVVRQTVPLTAQQAETAYRLALSNGAVAGAFCASATSRLVSQIPGMGHIRSTMSPKRLSEEFAKLPGAVTDSYYEDDSADLQDGIARENARLAANQEE